MGHVRHDYKGRFNPLLRAFIINTERTDVRDCKGLTPYTERWYVITNNMHAYYTESNGAGPQRRWRMP